MVATLDPLEINDAERLVADRLGMSEGDNVVRGCVAQPWEKTTPMPLASFGAQSAVWRKTRPFFR